MEGKEQGVDHPDAKVGKQIFKNKKQYSLDDLNARFRKSPSTLDELWVWFANVYGLL